VGSSLVRKTPGRRLCSGQCTDNRWSGWCQSGSRSNPDPLVAIFCPLPGRPVHQIRLYFSSPLKHFRTRNPETIALPCYTKERSWALMRLPRPHPAPRPGAPPLPRLRNRVTASPLNSIPQLASFCISISPALWLLASGIPPLACRGRRSHPEAGWGDRESVRFLGYKHLILFELTLEMASFGNSRLGLPNWLRFAFCVNADSPAQRATPRESVIIPKKGMRPYVR